MRDVEQKPRLTDEVGGGKDVARRLDLDARPRPGRPFFGADHATLQLADAAEVLVELAAVAGAQAVAQAAGLLAHRVEDALVVFQPANLRAHLLGSPSQEELGK